MKKVLYCILITTILFSSCSANPSKTLDETKKHSENTVNTSDEMRGVWIAFYELDFTDKSENAFRENIKVMFQNIADIGLNAVFVHVRSHSDAYYKSEIFPFSKFIAGEQGKDIGYDPLEIMIKLAHEKNLEFHAWLNPFRILADSTDLSRLSNDNPAKKFLTSGDKNSSRYVSPAEGGLYYNPAETAVQKLIIDGVREIIDNYDVDGIHIDDYFYPTTDVSFDKETYEIYKKNANTAVLSFDDFRRVSINKFISSLYRTIKQKDVNIQFGISPACNMHNNYNMLFADVKTWVQNDGFVDYITPQCYFGFEYDFDYKGQNFGFENLLKDWSGLVTNDNIKLYMGLGPYRAGEEMKLNSQISDEWVKNSDITARQIEFSRKNEKYKGFTLFSYSSLFTEAGEKERDNVKDLLNKK